MPQEFALLAKSSLHQRREDCAVGQRWRGQRHHANHSAVHPWRWRETLRADGQHVFHLVAPLQHHTEAAEVCAVRRSYHAMYDFFLQHEMLVFNFGRKL